MSLYLEKLTIHKQNKECLVSELSIKVQSGEVVTLMGPSGCGKSTVLNFIAGHLSNEFVASGELYLNQKSIAHAPAHTREIGILFQDDFLFPHLNIWQNLAFALCNSIKGQQRQQKAMQTLYSIELSHLAEQYPHQISGGQRARISLMRMLLAKPKVVLLDEPFSKLDETLREQFRNMVFEYLKQADIPTLMVTHDKNDIPAGSNVLAWPWQTQSSEAVC